MTAERDSLAAKQAAKRVFNGIEFLDEQVPGWDARIDLDELRLSSCMHCVLGQLFGDFDNGAIQLVLDSTDAVLLGFDRHGAEPDSVFDDLTAAWVSAIRRRREVTT